MIKFESYGIYEVHQEENIIKKVKAKKSLLGWEYASDGEYTREEIITFIEKDDNVFTILKSEQGEWITGSKVIIQTINGKKYIKTKPNDIAEDNLDNLPQY